MMKKILLSLLALITLGMSSAFAETVDLTRDMFHEWDDFKANANIVGDGGCDYQLGVSTGMPYGNGSVIGAQYADLSEYETLELTVTEGTPRLLMNRPCMDGSAGGYIEINSPSSNYVKSTEGGVWVIDLAQIVADKGYAHLNVIKGANWANVTITEMKLTKSDAPAAPKCPKLIFDVPNCALINLANTKSIHIDAVCPVSSNIEDDLFIEGTLVGKDGTNDHIANYTDFEEGADVSIARLTPGNSYTIIITKVAYGEQIDMDPITYMPIFENTFENVNGLATVDFTIMPEGEIEVSTLAWVNEAQGLENRLCTMTDATVLGTDAGPSDGKLSYFDITKYATLKVYGPAGQRARLFINRAEYASGTFQFYVDINEEGVGELDLATVYAAQPGATYIHLNGIKANAWGQKLQLNGVTVCGEGVEMIASNLVITEAGWATYCAPFAVNIPEGITAYIVNGVEDDVLVMSKIKDGIIPAYQPVVLYGDETSESIVGEPVDDYDMPQGIMMSAMEDEMPAEVGMYVLQSQNGKAGFYRVEEDSKITIPAWKCFLMEDYFEAPDYGTDPLVKAFYFENATTAINKLTSADKKQIFDVNGRQINKLQKGINIVNGVKILVK